MKEIVQIPMQVIEPIEKKDKRRKMKFEIRELKGRHDIYYVDEDKECFIVGCNSKSNAKLIAKVLKMDAERMVCDSFHRKTEEIQTHMEGASNGNK